MTKKEEELKLLGKKFIMSIEERIIQEILYNNKLYLTWKINELVRFQVRKERLRIFSELQELSGFIEEGNVLAIKMRVQNLLNEEGKSIEPTYIYKDGKTVKKG